MQGRGLFDSGTTPRKMILTIARHAGIDEIVAEPITTVPQVVAETGRVNADAAKTTAAKPKAKRPRDS